MARTEVRSGQIKDKNLQIDDFEDFGPCDGGGLTLTVSAGRLAYGTTIIDKTSQNLALTASTTNYVEIDGAGTASFNTTGFTDGRIPIASVVTGGSTITTITDNRSWNRILPIDNFTLRQENNELKVDDRIENNIMLNSFRIAINGSLVKDNMVDGLIDEFEDESGVDTGSSSGQSYDASGDFYSPGSGANTKLLLHLNGTDGATTTTDSSLSAHSFTFTGDAQLDTAVVKFGSAALLLDGTGDYISTGDSTDWDILNTTNFTIDFWAKHANSTPADSETYLAQFEDNSNRWRLDNNAGTIQFIFTSGG